MYTMMMIHIFSLMRVASRRMPKLGGLILLRFILERFGVSVLGLLDVLGLSSLGFVYILFYLLLSNILYIVFIILIHIL